jgi:hypothetical protein
MPGGCGGRGGRGEGGGGGGGGGGGLGEEGGGGDGARRTTGTSTERTERSVGGASMVAPSARLSSGRGSARIALAAAAMRLLGAVSVATTVSSTLPGSTAMLRRHRGAEHSSAWRRPASTARLSRDSKSSTVPASLSCIVTARPATCAILAPGGMGDGGGGGGGEGAGGCGGLGGGGGPGGPAGEAARMSSATARHAATAPPRQSASFGLQAAPRSRRGACCLPKPAGLREVSLGGGGFGRLLACLGTTLDGEGLGRLTGAACVSP